MDDKQREFLEQRAKECKFEIRVITPCRNVSGWIETREIPPTVREIAEKFSMPIDIAIAKCLHCIIDMGFGLGTMKRELSESMEEMLGIPIVNLITEDAYIIGSLKQVKRLEEIKREK